jgi:hypothetical protein
LLFPVLEKQTVTSAILIMGFGDGIIVFMVKELIIRIGFAVVCHSDITSLRRRAIQMQLKAGGAVFRAPGVFGKTLGE